MSLSRAAFLKTCCAALLGARVEPLGLLETTAPPSSATGSAHTTVSGGRFQLHDADANLFRPHLNTTFAVRSADGARARLMLAEVVEPPLTKNVEQFSLIFHAPSGTTVPQGTHALRHPALGDLDLFIVPIRAPNGRRTVYQACFSRHLRPSDVGRGQATTASPGRRT